MRNKNSFKILYWNKILISFTVFENVFSKKGRTLYTLTFSVYVKYIAVVHPQPVVKRNSSHGYHRVTDKKTLLHFISFHSLDLEFHFFLLPTAMHFWRYFIQSCNLSVYKWLHGYISSSTVWCTKMKIPCDMYTINNVQQEVLSKKK